MLDPKAWVSLYLEPFGLAKITVSALDVVVSRSVKKDYLKMIGTAGPSLV
jgi:hypothetical protein